MLVKIELVTCPPYVAYIDGGALTVGSADLCPASDK